MEMNTGISQGSTRDDDYKLIDVSYIFVVATNYYIPYPHRTLTVEVVQVVTFPIRFGVDFITPKIIYLTNVSYLLYIRFGLVG